MKPMHALPLTGILLLTGCSIIPGPAPLSGHATLSLTTQVRPAGYRTQAAVSPYGQSDIQHVQVQLFKVVGGSEQVIPGAGGAPLILDLPQASLSAPLTFANLNRDTTYRVRAFAYADSGTSSQISVDASSSVDVTLTGDDRPTLASLPVQLIDRAFSAAATISTGVTVTNGIVSSSGSATVGSGYRTSILAGDGEDDDTDGTGTDASFSSPRNMVLDGSGNLYVADSANHAIRKITPAGVVTTFVGDPDDEDRDDDEGGGKFARPSGMALDGSGNLYVSDTTANNIRKIVLSTLASSTLAGPAKATVPFIEDTAGFIDDTGTAARFSSPSGLACDGSTYLYVADAGNHAIRRVAVSNGDTVVIAGGSQGTTDGMGPGASFNQPSGVVHDGAGNLYVADSGNHRIRKVNLSTFDVTTFAGSTQGSADGTGTSAQFNDPRGLALDASGNLYVSEYSSHTLRMITPAGVVTTLAGTAGTSGTSDGSTGAVTFYRPWGLAVTASGSLLVSEYGNHVIRKLH